MRLGGAGGETGQLTNTSGAAVKLEWLAGVEGEELLPLLKDNTLVQREVASLLRSGNEQRNVPEKHRWLGKGYRVGENTGAYQIVSLSLGSADPDSRNRSWRTRIPFSSSVTVRTGKPI